MTPYLPDLEDSFDAGAARQYDPQSLVRFALSLPTDYWPGLALRWLDEGVPTSGLTDDLAVFETQGHRPQAQRHAARRLRRAAD